MRFEVLVSHAMRPRPAALMEALASSGYARGLDVVCVRHGPITPNAVMVTYGLGGHDRFAVWQDHRRRGDRLIAWDAGYWGRKTEDRCYRVAFDGFHSPQMIMRGENPGPYRWNESGLQITNRYHPDGDIVLIGNGPKARAIGADGWTAAKSRELRAKFPKRRVLYRPKRNIIERGVISHGVEADASIEKVLKDASLVVCRHSNVAVDACRMGIPVVCEDGAGLAIYPSRLEDEAKQPSAETRAEFLHRLAWWQWSESEIERGEPWPWLIGQMQ